MFSSTAHAFLAEALQCSSSNSSTLRASYSRLQTSYIRCFHLCLSTIDPPAKRELPTSPRFYGPASYYTGFEDIDWELGYGITTSPPPQALPPWLFQLSPFSVNFIFSLLCYVLQSPPKRRNLKCITKQMVMKTKYYQSFGHITEFIPVIRPEPIVPHLLQLILTFQPVR